MLLQGSWIHMQPAAIGAFLVLILKLHASLPNVSSASPIRIVISEVPWIVCDTHIEGV